MNSYEKLLYNVITKVVPAETIQMLQPDNVRKIIGAVGTKIVEIEAQQKTILDQQKRILDLLEHDNRSCGDGNGTEPFLLSGTHG